MKVGDSRSVDRAVAVAAEVVAEVVHRSTRSRCVWAVQGKRKSRCGYRHPQRGEDIAVRTLRYPG